MIRLTTPLPNPGTEYEREAVAFCREWLEGQPAFQLQTSGSTGTPKPIVLTRYQMETSARLTGDTFGLEPGDKALCCLNIRYIGGRMMLVRTLELDLDTWLVEPAAEPLRGLEEIPFAFAAFVPLQLQTLLAHTDRYLSALNRMKAIIVGGAAVSGALLEQLQVIQAPVYSTYGMTETVSHIAIQRLNGPDADGLFHALKGVDLSLDGRQCLAITAAASNHERIQTNDVAELFPDGSFRLLGRFDNIINSGGIKIQLEKTEQLAETRLARFFPDSRFFAWGFPDERLGQKLGLVVETTQIPDAEEILTELRGLFPPYQHPQLIRSISAFSETPSGKIDKRQTVARL